MKGRIMNFNIIGNSFDLKNPLAKPQVPGPQFENCRPEEYWPGSERVRERWVIVRQREGACKCLAVRGEATSFSRVISQLTLSPPVS